MSSLAYVHARQELGSGPPHTPNVRRSEGECSYFGSSKEPGATENTIPDPPWPGSSPLAAHACHSKFLQMLYGTRSP